MSKRKVGKDDSTPTMNEEEEQTTVKRDKKARKAKKEEATAQTERKSNKRKRDSDEDDKEEDEGKYRDAGPKDPIKENNASMNQENGAKRKKKKAKKEKRKDKKSKKAAQSSDEEVEKSKDKKEKKTNKKEKKEKKKKNKKAKKEKKDEAAEAKEAKSNNAEPAKEKEIEAAASITTSTSSNGGDQSAGWNNWGASSFGDDERKNKFLRLMGAKKAGDTQPQKKGLFGSLRASSTPAEPSAIDSTTEKKISNDLTSQFEDALQRRNFRGGIGLDSGAKKSDRSAEPHPHPYPGGKAASSKLYIDTQPKSMKFDD